MTASGWINSQSQERHHVHTPAMDQEGHNICSTCREVIITPITSSEDPRLKPEEVLYRLPDVLVALYYEGPEYGYPRAPVAPYVRDVAAFEGELNRYDSQVMWDILAELVM